MSAQQSRVEYYCSAYNCIVSEQPCPHCGDDGHKQLG